MCWKGEKKERQITSSADFLQQSAQKIMNIYFLKKEKGKEKLFFKRYDASHSNFNPNFLN